MTLKTPLFSRRMVGFAVACLLGAAPSAALGQIVKPLDKSTPILMQLKTEIVSFELTGDAQLPLGPDESPMDAGVRAVAAQDYNSSRSNNSSVIGPPPNDDPIDLDLFDGVEVELQTSVNLGFDLAFDDLDDRVDFSPSLGAAPVASFTENAVLAPVIDFTGITLDSSRPDLGILEARGWEHRGHVTVLKIAFGGGGGDIDLEADAIRFTPILGTGEVSIDPDGLLTNAFDVELSLTGTYNGAPFSIPSLTGRVVEQGRLTIQAIPEPSALAIGLLALSPLFRRYR